MAGNILDMSKIKQLLQLNKLGLSNSQIAKELKISRDKTNEYVQMAEQDSLDIDALLRLDDPVLEKRFHPSNPAYPDSRMETFLELLPDFVEQLSHKHVTKQLVWEGYKRTHPNGHAYTQFCYHLNQHKASADHEVSLPMSNFREGGNKLFIDFQETRVDGNDKYIILSKVKYIIIGNNDASFSVTRVHRFR